EIIELKILQKEELFEFDQDIDLLSSVDDRFIYIAKKNGMSFFEGYAFNKKMRKKLEEKIKGW
ncbi:MAG: hypothetical protein ACP5PA_03650, partial [Elusimicrobiales bacterium]